MQDNKTGNFYTFGISNNQSSISIVLKVVDLLGEKLDFFSPLEFEIQRDSDLETSKTSSTQLEL